MTSLEVEIGLDHLGLGRVLKQYQLEVPIHQREYAWEQKEVTTLYQDFAREVQYEGKSYFLGTIVTIPKQEQKLEVVDGQQRLATTAILLSAIRHFLLPQAQDIAKSIETDFLLSFDRNTREFSPRLRLNVDDDDYFRRRLETSDLLPVSHKPSNALLAHAFELAAEQVEGIVSSLDARDHVEALNRWINFIEYRAKVILLRVPDTNDAYRMFETLNDRGKRVSQADLVKNYLFGQAGERRIREVQQRWGYMRGALESMENEDSTNLFLRHALTAVRGLVRGSDVYQAVQDHASGPLATENFSVELEGLAHTYVATFNSASGRWNQHGLSVRRPLDVLNLLNVNPMRPVLLAIAKQFGPTSIGPALSFCVSLSVRLLIGKRTRTGTVENALAKTAHEIWQGNIKDTRSLKVHLAAIVPDDKQFSTVFAEATVATSKLARYYLRSLELAVNNASEPWHIPNDDESVINLEHVLPFKPISSWPNFSDSEVRQYRNRIGNLVLLKASENSTLNSDSFAKKKEVYAQCPYKITKSVSKVHSWNVDQIINRQKWLALFAPHAWPI